MIDFTLGICCLSRDFPAGTRRLTTDWVESDACAVVFQLCHTAAFSSPDNLVPRAYDPSGLRQESRALGATISGMRHRCRCAVSRITRIRLFPLFFHNGCSQSSRFLPQARRIVGSGDEIGPQRPRSFWSAPRIATSGQFQQRKSTIHGLPVTLRMLRLKSDKSDWFWFQSIVFTNPFKTGMSLDLARGRDSWC